MTTNANAPAPTSAPTAAPSAPTTPAPGSAPANPPAPPKPGAGAPPNQAGAPAADKAPAGAPAAAGAKPGEGAKPDERGSDRWAAATRAEQRAREAAAEAKREREELASQRKAFEERERALAERASLLERAKAGDWEARDALLRDTGITYDELTKRALNRGKPDPTADLKREIEALKADLAKRSEAEQQAHAHAARTQAVATFAQTVKGGGERFELVAQELESDPKHVEEVLVELARQKPDLSFEAAADLYEKHLLDQTKRRLSLSKVKALSTPNPEPGEVPKQSSNAAPQAQHEGTGASANGSRTLTNADATERATDSSERPAPVGKPYQRRLREKEALARATAAVAHRGAKKPG